MYGFKKILRKVSINKVGITWNSNTKTYSKVSTFKDETINADIIYLAKYVLKFTDKQNNPLITYWLPKMHKAPVVCRFIVGSKTLTKTFSNTFKMIYLHVETFYQT